ncbi:MAG: TonB-dependent receptor, partial [Gammaproteobacteria bacterium]|nr:TonB-dependent receptor [Gammaproteobacteria bacterium]
SGISQIDHDTWSVSLGSVYELFESYNIGLSVGRSQRAPSLEELLASGPHLATETFEIGDANLGEEITSNIDFSLRRTAEAWSWKINLFANYIEDYIFQQFQDTNGDGVADRVDEDGVPGAGDLLLVRFEQENALFYGAEFESTWHTVVNRNHIDIRLFGDVVRGILDNDEDIPRISPARVGLGFDFRRNRWGAKLDIINVFEQNDTAELEEGTGGYVMLNAGLSYTLPVREADARFYLRGTNLLDRDARRHTSFLKERAPLPGRAAIAGIRLSF